jgi:ATP-dependent Clp protease protease subunit
MGEYPDGRGDEFLPNPFEQCLSELRYILLYDEIDARLAKDINSKLLVMSIKKPRAPIFIEINSPGGSVADGIAIINTIRSIQSPVVTIINGEAVSMAGLISIVGDERFIMRGSYWMGHPMEDGVGGNVQTIYDRAQYLKKLENQLTGIFKEKTILDDEGIQKMLRGELWLDPEEALKNKLVDRILDSHIRMTLAKRKR